MQNTEILEKFEDMKKNMADGSLTNGLVIQDLENRIRNLEADVTAKKRIILEKSETNNALWEKIKALEIKEEKMFSSRLSYSDIKDKFHWQAVKRLELDVQHDDTTVIKDMVKTFHAFFGKIIRVKGMRFIILYFNTETHLMNAINESAKINDISQGLWLKKKRFY
uniref:Uncharacterized protein n=1 Tax=Rhizophagus irregularis (strain DAOM 181602 / DAOM 197198 / MUCL 43194) TaxID=747089 RepID=U9SFC7_RHIID